MVVDCLYFNGEYEVLEARLNILNDFVDYFVLVESDLTFSGEKKPLFFKEKELDYTNFLKKIIYYKIPDTIYEHGWYKKSAILSPNTGRGEHYWIREWIQKESLREVLAKGCKDDDFVYISDVDEIWNPKMHLDITKDVVYKPKQLPYLYYFNQRTDEDWLGWTGTTACKFSFIKNGIINHIRTDDLTEYEVVENGGWHFNAIGGKQKKVNAFKHPVYYDDGVWANREINMRKDESDLPDYLLNKKEKYAKFFM